MQGFHFLTEFVTLTHTTWQFLALTITQYVVILHMVFGDFLDSNMFVFTLASNLIYVGYFVLFFTFDQESFVVV